ncbi:MAG: hypothetical protein JWN98_997, partial [Abditibacteriota bacterium]|nr:hypothetical protein [Abditibacteriota bacterium]
MSKYFSLLFFALLSLSGSGVSGVAQAQERAQSFTTISGVRISPLSNGVQISINADGILQYRNPDTNGSSMQIAFPGARNGTGKYFFNVNRYPVSHIQLS